MLLRARVHHLMRYVSDPTQPAQQRRGVQIKITAGMVHQIIGQLLSLFHFNSSIAMSLMARLSWSAAQIFSSIVFSASMT